MSAGYDPNMFLNQNESNKYLCAICRCVYKEPMNIGCREEHIFCKQCLDKYFINNISTKSCPSCREPRLRKYNVKSSRSIGRLVKSLRVQCQLQYECDRLEIIWFAQQPCDWNGELGELAEHINLHCALFMVSCQHCYKAFRRYKLVQHIQICPQKREPCKLRCNKMIKRVLMKDHMNNECAMKRLSCDECKQNVLRKDMDHHTSDLCPESEIFCPFVTYGCSDKIKRRLIDAHLQNEKVCHLEMEVNSLKVQMAKIVNGNANKILLLLKSKSALLCDIKSKAMGNRLLNIPSFMNQEHNQYCIGKGVSFNDAKQFGFDPEGIDVFGNDIVFGISNDKISALCVKTQYNIINECGYIPFQGYASLYSNECGLLLIGGQYIENNHLIHRAVANNNIVNIKCNDNKCTQQTLITLPYAATYPSVYAMNHNNNETLFVCGGWWNNYLSTCYVYNFGTKRWTDLKNMNHAHQSGGICEWKERGNKIIVAAGYPDIKEVEEYDINKNVWIDLPKLNKKHRIYPALLISNNILFCIGGVNTTDDNLGCIELYDPRDRANKWIYVDTVEHYFGIRSDGGVGNNCFLPL